MRTYKTKYIILETDDSDTLISITFRNPTKYIIRGYMHRKNKLMFDTYIDAYSTSYIDLEISVKEARKWAYTLKGGLYNKIIDSMNEKTKLIN